MERYKSNGKIKDKKSTFSYLRDFFKKIKYVDNKLYEIYDRMEELEQRGETSSEEYNTLCERAEKFEAIQKKLDVAKSQVKKLFFKIGALVLAGIMVITGTALAISNSIYKNRENSVIEALAKKDIGIVQMYDASPEKFEQLLSSPEEITQLALDTLKVQLADHYKIPKDKFEDFSIYYHSTSGKETCSISYQEKIISQYLATKDSQGEILGIQNNTLPPDLLKTIKKIAASQNENSPHKSYAALNCVLSEDTITSIKTELPDYLPETDHNYER